MSICKSPKTVKRECRKPRNPEFRKPRPRILKQGMSVFLDDKRRLKSWGKLYSPRGDLDPEMILIFLCVSPEMIPDKRKCTSFSLVPDEFIQWQLNMGLWIAQR